MNELNMHKDSTLYTETSFISTVCEFAPNNVLTVAITIEL